MAPLSHQGERGRQSGTDVAQYRLADHPPMPIKGFTTAPAADGKGLVITLPRALPTGSYDLQWTVMGNDHQPVSGAYSFKVR